VRLVKSSQKISSHRENERYALNNLLHLLLSRINLFEFLFSLWTCSVLRVKSGLMHRIQEKQNTFPKCGCSICEDSENSLCSSQRYGRLTSGFLHVVNMARWLQSSSVWPVHVKHWGRVVAEHSTGTVKTTLQSKPFIYLTMYFIENFAPNWL